MLNFSFWDIVLIMMVSLIVFGPSKLPNIAKSMGKGLFEFRKITSQVSESIKEESENIKKEVSLQESEQQDQDKDENKNDSNGINLNK